MRDDRAVFEPLNKPIDALKKRLSAAKQGPSVGSEYRALSLIHISEPTRPY